jgi:hypothetical protein
MDYPQRIRFQMQARKGVVSDNVVLLLSQEWPLTAKEIHHRVARQKEASYQAVHKGLLELMEQNVVLKSETQYFLNLAWLEELVRFGANTKKAYVEKTERLKKYRRLKKQWIQ